MPLHTPAGHCLQTAAVLLLISLHKQGLQLSVSSPPAAPPQQHPASPRHHPPCVGKWIGAQHSLSYHLIEKNQKPCTKLGFPTTHTPLHRGEVKCQGARLVHQKTCASLGTKVAPSPAAGNIPQAPTQHSQIRNHAWGKQEGRTDGCIPLQFQQSQQHMAMVPHPHSLG